MTDPTKDAVGILRGIKNRVEELEQAVSSSEGVPNLLRQVTDGVDYGDDVAVTTRTGAEWSWDGGDMELEFDGTDDGADLVDSGLDLGTDGTVLVWAEVYSDTGDHQILVDRYDAGYGYALFINKNDGKVAGRYGSSGLRGGSEQYGNRAYFALRNDHSADDCDLLVDGSVVASTTSGGDASKATTTEVGYRSGVGLYLSGAVNRVAIYNRALSDSEIDDADNGNLPTNGLLGHYEFDVFPNLLDESGNANHGTGTTGNPQGVERVAGDDWPGADLEAEFVRGDADEFEVPVDLSGENDATVIGTVDYHDLVGSGNISGCMYRTLGSSGNAYGFAVHTRSGGELGTYLRNRSTGNAVQAVWPNATAGEYLIAGIKRGSDAEFWADADRKGASTHPDGDFTLDGVEFRLGNTDAGDEFDGTMADMAFYNRALSQSEQQDILDTGTYPTNGLVGLFEFDVFPNPLDESGNANHGSINSGQPTGAKRSGGAAWG